VAARLRIGTFAGVPREGFGFYADLAVEGNNARAWFDAHRDTYERCVRLPLEEVLARAADEFGDDGHVFRPNRDVRFSADKRPYKDHAGAVIGWRDGTGAATYYVQVSADGLLAASGYHELSRAQLERFRQKVDDGRTGGALVRAVRAVRGTGLSVDGSTLVRAPRGYPVDHPRIDLLRHTRLTSTAVWPVARWMSTPDAYDRIADAWRAGGPINRWLERHVGA
jgi:uncharacterized protein (TIGR02453 family)